MLKKRESIYTNAKIVDQEVFMKERTSLWKNSNGTIQRVKDMNHNHIMNVINKLKRGEYLNKNVDSIRWIETFTNELIYRGRNELLTKLL